MNEACFKTLVAALCGFSYLDALVHG